MSTTRINADIFKGSLAMIATQFNYKLEDDKIKLYWNRFKDMEPASFLSAVQQIMDTFVPTSQTPYPLFVHFLGGIGTFPGNPVGKDVVRRVKYGVTRCGRYDSVNFGDSRIHCTIKFYGGWQKVCDWTDKDWEIKEKAFIETYNAMKPDPTQTHLPGIHEHNNTGKYAVQPPKLVYEMMKEKPVELLVFNPRVKVLPIVQEIPGMDKAIESMDLPFGNEEFKQ